MFIRDNKGTQTGVPQATTAHAQAREREPEAERHGDLVRNKR